MRLKIPHHPTITNQYFLLIYENGEVESAVGATKTLPMGTGLGTTT
jgi:hypothetical protein